MIFFQRKGILIALVLVAGAAYILLKASPLFNSVALGKGNPNPFNLNHSAETTAIGSSARQEAQRHSYGPRNSTLGFQKIFYISLPERSDRQQSMNLVASYMGLDFTFIPGVNGSNTVEKALPYDPKNKPKKPPTAAELGCWRAHANVWSQILEENISSALILEDDIDFTVGIRDVLSEVSIHLQHLTGAGEEDVYGLADENAWDVLSLGHCMNERPPEENYPAASKIYQAWEDEYAPETDQKSYLSLLPGAKSQRIRVLHPTYKVACTQAYVVSLAGARRLLFGVGGPGGSLNRPIDLVMLRYFRTGKLKGYTVAPSIFGQWKSGEISKDSDIPKEHEWGIEKGSGKNVVRGVREEMEREWKDRNIWKEIETSASTSSSSRRRRRRSQKLIPKNTAMDINQ